MQGKKRLTIFTFLFFLIMLLLTCFSRMIHEAGLPHVEVQTLKMKIFSVEDEYGEQTIVRKKCYAANDELVNRKEYYIVDVEEKNGEERTFIKRVYLTFGEKTDGYYPILDGDYEGEEIVIHSSVALKDGEEVVVTKP